MSMKIEKRVDQASVPTDEARLAYTIGEVCKLAGIGRTALYQAIDTRELRAVKFGRKTLVLAKDLHAWLEGLPEKSQGPTQNQMR